MKLKLATKILNAKLFVVMYTLINMAVVQERYGKLIGSGICTTLYNNKLNPQSQKNIGLIVLFFA